MLEYKVVRQRERERERERERKRDRQTDRDKIAWSDKHLKPPRKKAKIAVIRRQLDHQTVSDCVSNEAASSKSKPTTPVTWGWGQYYKTCSPCNGHPISKKIG